MSARSSYNFSEREREKEKGDSLAEINCRLIHELFAMQLADLFAPSTWRPFVTAECCLILCVSKMDECLNFETDVRDKFQGGIWRVCLKSNVRVRYFFALSRWQLCCSPKLICRVWYKRTSATRITFSHFFLILLRNSRSLSPMHVGEPKGSESYLPLAHSFVISLVIKWANACTVIWFVVN